jgi:RNA recognition motif-containing protein
MVSRGNSPPYGVEDNPRMSFTVFLGNLPAWVTADDIRGWLAAENLVADAIKVIRNPETQESKGFAFIDAPNSEEMGSIIRRFDRAPLEDRMLRANPAQPPKPRTGGPAGPARPGGPGFGPERPSGGGYGRPPRQYQSHGPSQGTSHGAPHGAQGTAQTANQDAGQEHAPHSGANNVADAGSSHSSSAGSNGPNQGGVQGPAVDQRPPRRGKRAGGKKTGTGGPSSAFAEELAKAL